MPRSNVTRKAVGALLPVVILFACFAGQSWAQSSVSDDRTAELVKKIQQLEADLAAIKAELATSYTMLQQRSTAVALCTRRQLLPAATTAPADDAAALAALAPDTSQGDEHTLGPLEFRGYSDFSFGRPIFSTLPAGGLTGSTTSFSLGDFDLFVNARIGSHLSVLGELLITSDFSNEFSAEMDRLMLTYSANKYFKISGGKYHTAIGYYTNEFYRARYFQTTTGAPILFTDEDDGEILPVRSSIGLTATAFASAVRPCRASLGGRSL